MTFIPGIRRLFRLGGIHDVESAVDDELRFHFDMAVRELVAGGMCEDEARREAERRFGDVGSARARLVALDRGRVDAERRADWWSALGQDLRYAVRGFRLKPGFTAGVVLTLGLGIGANATMFGIVDRLLLRPPPYLAHPGRVHRVYFERLDDGERQARGGTSYRQFLDMRRYTSDFDVVAGIESFTAPFLVGAGASTEELPMRAASAGFWRLFEMRPALGRFFTADEDSVGGASDVVVLGHEYWLGRFGGSSEVLGRRLLIGSWWYTIIGVAPPGFQGVGLSAPAFIIPLTAYIGQSGRQELTEYGNNTVAVIARRRAGVTLERATEDLSGAFLRSHAQQAAEQDDVAPGAIARPRAIAAPVQQARGPNPTSDVNVTIWLVGVAATVLLIACANVSSLLLARALGRRREIAVRLALGVGRGRLVLQLLTESVVLALLGGAVGLVLAQWGGGVLRATLLPGVTSTGPLSDGRALLVCAAVALAAGIVTGMAPAWDALRSDLTASLKAGAREGACHRSRVRGAMQVVQTGLSVVLLVGAGLFVRSLHVAWAVPLGYDADRVLHVATIPREDPAARPSAERAAIQERLLERAAALPGVERAARQVTVPFGRSWGVRLFVAGIDSVPRLGRFEPQGVSPEYFRTLGIPLLRGRGIEAGDRRGSPPVMVVSRSMARVLWPGREPIGECVRLGADTASCTRVVGVADDIRTQSLSSDERQQYYLPIEQVPERMSTGLFLRVRGEAAASVETVRRALQPLLPGAAYLRVTPLADLLVPRRRAWQLGATMFTVFGALALLVASVGLYSVISYGVAQRSQELAVRTALGAQARDIVRMVVGEGLRTVLVATVLGLGVAWVAARWVGPLLFQTSPRDPVIYGGVAVVLVLVALAASAIPAVRAARVDPIAALRAD